VSSGIETRTISAGSGRELCVELAGEPDGKPILYHPGEPMSRHLYGGWIADAEEKGIRLIGYDRPGYGGSTAHPGYTVASAAADVRAIAETLGHNRLGIWGISGGGPYALGCAALLPEVAVAVAAVAPLAPYGVEGFDFFAGMGESNVEGFKLFFSDPEAARRDLYEGREEILAATPPPVRGGKQPRVLFVTQATTRPPTFVLFTTGFLEAGYRRFLERKLRETFGFEGSPIRINVRVREKRGAPKKR